jgi:hypothetical protein
VDLVESQVASCRRDFRQLEEDVDHVMEEASTRLQRARTAESNVKRKQAPPAGAPPGMPGNGQVPPGDLSAEFAHAQAMLRDGVGPFGRR